MAQGIGRKLGNVNTLPTPSNDERTLILCRFYTPNLHILARPQGKIDLGDGTILKYGPKVRLMEAARMRYISQTTTLPVPRVHYAFEHDGYGYIVMDQIQGNTLIHQIDTLDDAQLDDIARTLVCYIHEIRALSNDGTTGEMGSWPEGPYQNIWFDDPHPVRAFKWLEEMQEYLLRLSSRTYVAGLLDPVRPAPVVLCHGDLNPTNIMVQGGKITGIIDWETLGFYPEWWECMSVSNVVPDSRWLAALRRMWDEIQETEETWSAYSAGFSDVWFRKHVF